MLMIIIERLLPYPAQLINSTELQLSVGAGNGIKFTYPSDQPSDHAKL